MSSKILNVEKKKAIEAYKKADKFGKKLLINLFKDKIIFERNFEDITNYEDACEVLGKDPNVNATAREKLDTIWYAIIGDWKVDYTNPKQKRWCIWLEKVSSGSALRFRSAYYGTADTNTASGLRLFETEPQAKYFGTKFLNLHEEEVGLR